MVVTMKTSILFSDTHSLVSVVNFFVVVMAVLNYNKVLFEIKRHNLDIQTTLEIS